jgi:hypothetical protein
VVHPLKLPAQGFRFVRRHLNRRNLTRRRLEALVVVVIVLAVSIGVVTVAPGLVGSSTGVVDGVLSIGATVAYPPSTFWSVAAHAPKLLNSSLAARLNQTPITLYRYGGGGDTANQTTGVSYNPNGVPSASGSSGDAQFIQFCKWRNCRAIMSVPGEINDPGAAAVTVAFVEKTLGYDPDFWSIGNEPQLWTHYGIPWTHWRSTDASTPTPQQYAVLVQHYITAMKSVDTKVRVIGIQSASGGLVGASWIQPVVALNGPNLAAVAYHSYPGGVAPPGGSVIDFFHAARTYGFPWDYPTTEAEVRQSCASCHLPVFIDEFNGAVAGYYSQFVTSYPDVPVVAAAVAVGLQLNTTHFSFFDLQSTDGLPSFGLLDAMGHPRPSYSLYSVFFQNLSIHAIHTTSIVGGPGGAVAVVGTNPTTESLLVANENATSALRLNVSGSGFPISGPAAAWSWDPSSPAPSWTMIGAGAVPSTWLVPPEGILLVNVGI